jgi:hypothetical protein
MTSLETVSPPSHPPSRPRSSRPRSIHARKQVRVPQEALYAFLATLDNHWLLTDRFVSLVRLHGPVSSRTGGEITIRGPWGLHRHARTRLETHDDASCLVGTAVVGPRTIARVTWALTPIPGGTDVALSAAVLTAGPLDRVLLVAAAPWLRRRFLAAIVRLEHEAARTAAAPAPSPRAEPHPALRRH